MRKSSTYKILAAVMALSTVNVFVPHNMLAYDITSDNTTISTGPITENIYGNRYSFTINGGTIYGEVFGAGNSLINYNEDASGGNVTINGNAEVKYAVYGGRSGKGEAYNNTVNISGGSVSGTVYGGRSISREANNNTASISGGTVNYIYGGGTYESNAYDNIVNISGKADVKRVVRGGNSHSGNAHHNTVNISGGTINMLNLDAGDSVCGGYSYSGEAYYNTVNISGGSVSGAVYGGYIDHSGSAYDNEVVISGSAVIENANLYGSNSSNNTGNTLTINGWSNSTQSVKNFNDIAFKNIAWNEDGTVLTITAGDADDLKNTTIDTIHIAGGSNINVGESMTLIDGNISSIGDVTDTFTAGVAREGLGSTSVNGNVVTLILTA